MQEASCRQCGTAAPVLPTGEFTCPECGWRQLLSQPSTAPSGPRWGHGNDDEPARGASGLTSDGDATAVVPRPEPGPVLVQAPVPAEAPRRQEPVIPRAAAGSSESPSAALDRAGWSGLSGEAFTRWCGRLLERFGFAVALAEGEDRDCDLELRRGGEISYVRCIGSDQARPGPVARAEAQRLLGAMVGAAVRRGLLVTSGSFDPRCRAFADAVGDDRIALIDGDHLEHTIREMTEGPLSPWWR